MAPTHHNLQYVQWTCLRSLGEKPSCRKGKTGGREVGAMEGVEEKEEIGSFNSRNSAYLVLSRERKDKKVCNSIDKYYNEVRPRLEEKTEKANSTETESHDLRDEKGDRRMRWRRSKRAKEEKDGMKGRRRYQRSLSPWLILSLNSNADFQFDHERAYKCIKTRERRAGRERLGRREGEGAKKCRDCPPKASTFGLTNSAV